MSSGIVPQRYPIKNDITLDPKLSHYCAPKHWDPTMIFRRSVPQTPSVALPTDPRPWTKICLQYVNSGAAEHAPSVPGHMVFPGASDFYPPNRYSAAIDNESLLRRLDRPLNEDLLPANAHGHESPSCFPQQYTLPKTSDALQQSVLLPPHSIPRSKMVRELEYPAVLEKNGQYSCSKEAMACDMAAAPRFWNNHTKLAKYNQKEGKCGETLWQYTNNTYPSASNPPRVYQ